MTLQEGRHPIRKTLRGMKCHVFQHVSQTVLLLLFHQRTDILHQVIISISRLSPRVQNVISQPVFQFTITKYSGTFLPCSKTARTGK